MERGAPASVTEEAAGLMVETLIEVRSGELRERITQLEAESQAMRNIIEQF